MIGGVTTFLFIFIVIVLAGFQVRNSRYHSRHDSSKDDDSNPDESMEGGLGLTSMDLSSFDSYKKDCSSNNKKPKGRCEGVLSSCTTSIGYGGMSHEEGIGVNRVDYHSMTSQNEDVKDSRFIEDHQQDMLYHPNVFKEDRPDITYAELSIASCPVGQSVGPPSTSSAGSSSLCNLHPAQQRLYSTIGRLGNHVDMSDTEYAMLDFNGAQHQGEQFHHPIGFVLSSLGDSSFPSPASSITTTSQNDYHFAFINGINRQRPANL
jgi:hypothetical protein